MGNTQGAIRIGGGSGFWGDSGLALPQFLKCGDVDYVAFDYLAEITMSILARARQKSLEAGYALDFVTQVVGPNLQAIAATGTKILSNAGGVNPQACGKAIRALISEAGLNLKVAVVTGDDLTDRAAELRDRREMFTGEPFPDPECVASINAYLGAFPIAEALRGGADIVITGRCVDSALPLAACVHAFDWPPDAWDRLAAGSLAGHLIECGPQACGGNFTDWEAVADSLAEVGYPIAEINAQGDLVITKPPETGGQVTRGTVAEQMLYEISDPRAYTLPDVICDFSEVTIVEQAANRVALTGARGRPAPDNYKVSTTFADGWKIATLWFFIGSDAAQKALTFARNALRRTRRQLSQLELPDFTETLVEPFGNEAHYGRFATHTEGREVAIKIAARHPDPKALQLLLKEITGLALAAPPGLALFSGGRPKPSPVVRLFSLLLPKDRVEIRLDLDGAGTKHTPANTPLAAESVPEAPGPAKAADPESDNMIEVPLRALAWARSGDKGDSANIGVIPRRLEHASWIWQALTEQELRQRFDHFLTGPVERFYLPGTGAMNIVLHAVLGGGGIASLRNDPQGKSYAQLLLDTPVTVPSSLLSTPP
ncbi:MAG: acyclic terpene utilization AtuA family protein [Pseudomonadota bacterium]